MSGCGKGAGCEWGGEGAGCEWVRGGSGVWGGSRV